MTGKTSFPSPFTSDPRQLYLFLMEEAKDRLAFIVDAAENSLNLPVWMVREICSLQLRFLCEIIAIGCLAAHGTITGAQAIKDYEPGLIFKKLRKLHEHFYPQPMVISRAIPGHVHMTGTPHAEHLSKDELPKLWGKCGDSLHRSPMAKVLTDMSRFSGDVTDIIEAHNKIVGLLSSHWISLADGKSAIFVLLKDATAEGRASATNITFSHQTGRVALQTMTIGRPLSPENDDPKGGQRLSGPALREPPGE